MTDQQIEQFAMSHGFSAWFRVSAKEGSQVDEAGTRVISLVLEREDVSTKRVSPPINGITVGADVTDGKTRKKCC